MFGLSKASKAKKIYDSLSPLLQSLKDWTPNEKLPEDMWTDPYMIGYFFKTVALSELITNKKPYSANPDQMIAKLCVKDYICPNEFSKFEKKLFAVTGTPMDPLLFAPLRVYQDPVLKTTFFEIYMAKLIIKKIKA